MNWEQWQRQHTSTKWAEGLLAVLLIYMTADAVRTQMKAPILASAREIARQPWGAFSFKDFYANLALISAFAVVREKNVWRSAAWITAFAALGSLATLPYALLQLWKLSGAPAREVFDSGPALRAPAASSTATDVLSPS